MWLVIPVKDFDAAKQRLAPCLSPDERSRLYQAMLKDVLECVRQVEAINEIALVTGDAGAIKMAAGYGAQVIQEPVNRSHTEAVRFAVAQLKREGVETLLTLPGDVPLVSPAELNKLIAAHAGSPAFTIAPSRDRMGSNAVMCSPPDIVSLHFGPDSFYPHLQQARRAGIEPTVVALPGVSVDIDTPADLELFLTMASRTRTRRFLDSSGITARLASGRDQDAGGTLRDI